MVQNLLYIVLCFEKPYENIKKLFTNFQIQNIEPRLMYKKCLSKPMHLLYKSSLYSFQKKLPNTTEYQINQTLFYCLFQAL